MNQQRPGPLPPRGPSTFASQSAAGALSHARPARHIQFTPSHTALVVPPTLATSLSATARPSVIGTIAVWTFVALGWTVFAAWWVIVLQRESARSFGVALGLLAATLVTSAVAMALWTRHNIRVARRGKRGKSSLYIPMQWERDTLGRPLELPVAEDVCMAAEVRVVLRDGAKAYVVPEEEEEL